MDKKIKILSVNTEPFLYTNSGQSEESHAILRIFPAERAVKIYQGVSDASGQEPRDYFRYWITEHLSGDDDREPGYIMVKEKLTEFFESPIAQTLLAQICDNYVTWDFPHEVGGRHTDESRRALEELLAKIGKIPTTQLQAWEASEWLQWVVYEELIARSAADWVAEARSDSAILDEYDVRNYIAGKIAEHEKEEEEED